MAYCLLIDSGNGRRDENGDDTMTTKATGRRNATATKRRQIEDAAKASMEARKRLQDGFRRGLAADEIDELRAEVKRRAAVEEGLEG